MSIVHSEHIGSAPRGRHGAHYKLINGKPGMVLYNSMIEKRVCPECGKANYPVDCGRFKDDGTTCVQCGRDLSDIELEVYDNYVGKMI